MQYSCRENQTVGCDLCYLEIVICIKCESVVDPLRQHQQITLAALDTNPTVIQVTNIKVTCR